MQIGILAFNQPRTNSLPFNLEKFNEMELRFLLLLVLPKVLAKNQIVNGSLAKIGQFPWSVHLERYWRSFETGYCGGALISNRVVLTAAHCLDGTSYIILVFGSNTNKYNSPGRFTTLSRNFIRHPHYKPSRKSFSADIGLVFTKRIPIQWNIRPVRLMTDIIIRKTFGTLAGLGRLDYRTLTDQLRYTHLIVETNSACELDAYYSGWKQKNWPPDHLCGKIATGFLCHQIDGGVLVKQKTNIALGVASFAVNKCKHKALSGFTEIAHYVPWIVKTVGTAQVLLNEHGDRIR